MGEGGGVIVAVLLAVAVGWGGVRWGSRTAGGSDSYGYVSQAGLWRQGTLTIRQDIVREAPWPIARQTWMPLGDVPAAGSSDRIVPSYAPGLPVLMALAHLIRGERARVSACPLCCALLADIYALGNVPTSLRQYAGWTSEVQTPVVLVAALFFVLPRWAPAKTPAARLLLGGTIAVVLGSYLFYMPFDAWWYLRFLLPMWPVLLLLTVVGISGIASRVLERSEGAGGWLAAAIVVALTL